MYWINLPLILSSFTFAIPCVVAFELQNVSSAICWGSLAVTSSLVHATKKPYHLHGPNNCIPWLYAMDIIVLYCVAIQSMIDGWQSGPIGLFLSTSVIGYSAILFYGGKAYKKFVYDTSIETQILSHLSTHLLSSFGGCAVLLLRSYCKGSLISLHCVSFCEQHPSHLLHSDAAFP